MTVSFPCTPLGAGGLGGIPYSFKILKQVYPLWYIEVTREQMKVSNSGIIYLP